MYDICGMSNTISGMLLCTVYTMYVFCCLYTLYMCTFGVFWVWVCDDAIMYYAVCTCMWMYGVLILMYTCGASDSHSGLKSDQMVGEIFIIMQRE